ncbi:AUGMIN subunit 5-like [Populus alba x Populus x berolinensis]|uniref:AUGMIN subunit 5-like n=1 Tax=Populus alba x Populus x berolinensis TaxID=444605 RepID=A0AAD6W7D9_9ROSI|nr:AUGMIN subunit 5-like [Populus alba x Populus x berolinensis]
MQGSSSAVAQPEAILEWLQKEMGYRPLGPYSATTSKSQLPSIDAVRKICRGNMIPIWVFLVKRVKSEKTVENIRKNILVHGSGGGLVNAGKDEGRSKGGRRKEKVGGESGGGSSMPESREVALQEREMAVKEVERLRGIVRRQRKDLRARMIEVSREEAERKRMLDERAKNRHKQVMLEAYDQQCDEAAKIFAEYHKRLHQHVDQARDAQRSSIDSSIEEVSSFSANSEKEAVYSTVKGTKSADDVVLIETTCERNIRKACESLAVYMVERIRNSFPAYEGSGIHLNPQSEAAKLAIDFDGEIPDDVRTVIVNCLKNPPLLLRAITAYTSRLKTLVSREIEKTDVRADAELLRYKYENNRVMDVSSTDTNSSLHHQLYGYGKIATDMTYRGSQNQLLERQKAHVQQFLATEDALNKAAEARDLCQKLLKRLHGTGEEVSSNSIVSGGTTQNMSSPRQFELEVWAKEREAAGLRTSLNTLMSEIQRLNKLCAERKEAEDSLRKKWKKIEEFDARRSELEAIYTTLLKFNTEDAAAFWKQQPLIAREYASITIIPACTIVVDIANNAKDLIDKEVNAFSRCPDNSLYMLPSTSQALLESMGSNGSTGPEAAAAAEKNAALLTARAGARDPSAIPSICRVSAALQYPAGLEGSDAGLASVLESLEFCLKLRGSEASVLEDLAKAINLVHIRHDLVESGHAVLNHAYRSQQEYERTTNFCLDLANEQEKIVVEKWLPELKTTALNAQKCLEDCKYVRGLLDDWWEQPASTVVDWVTVDGQNVAAWHNHVKQLLAFYDKELM